MTGVPLAASVVFASDYSIQAATEVVRYGHARVFKATLLPDAALPSFLPVNSSRMRFCG